MRAAEMENNGFLAFQAKGKDSGQKYYVLPSEKCSEENANLQYYKELSKKSWSSFNYEYQIFWLVSFCTGNDADSWMTESSCSCPVFFKRHLCKGTAS